MLEDLIMTEVQPPEPAAPGAAEEPSGAAASSALGVLVQAARVSAAATENRVTRVRVTRVRVTRVRVTQVTRVINRTPKQWGQAGRIGLEPQPGMTPTQEEGRSGLAF